jgi:hypothetical protein
MDSVAYDDWSEKLESRIHQLKKGKREEIFRQAFAQNQSQHSFFPKWGFTMGQLAYYTFLNSKKNKR